MDYKITIEVKNVGAGDAADLVQQIHDNWDEDFDAGLGDFLVTTSERVGGSWFPVSFKEED